MLEKLLLAMTATLAFYVTFRPSLPAPIGSIAASGDMVSELAHPINSVSELDAYF